MKNASLLLVGAAACTDPAITMRLELPPAPQTEGFQLACLSSFEVKVRADNDDDDKGACIQVREGLASFADVQREIAGQFEIDLPRSTLQGVEVRASTGRCDKVDPAGGDTIFYGSGPYSDGNDLAIRVALNQSCNTRSTVTVRPVDFLKLARAAPCSEAAVATGSVTGGTIHPELRKRAAFDPNADRADVTGGVAALQLYNSSADGSCVALHYDASGGPASSRSCARRGRGVCSTGDEIELPIIDDDIAFRSLDSALFDPARDGAVFGAIWGTGATAPVQLDGATIAPVDPSRAKIVYADYPAGAELVRSLPGRATTNATGLFIAYVTEPMDFVVSHPGYRDQTVRLGSPVEPSAAIVVLEK